MRDRFRLTTWAKNNVGNSTENEIILKTDSDTVAICQANGQTEKVW